MHEAPQRYGNFLDHLKDPSTFTISVQCDPRSDTSSHHFQHLLDAVRKHPDVQSLDINSPSSRAAQDALLLACVAQQRGVFGIPHITCRDASFGGVVNQVLAAVAHFGIETILVITGDRPKKRFHQCGEGVFQGDAVSLVRELDRVRHGAHVDSQQIDRSRFAIGVAFDYTTADLARERERLAAKRSASANFVMSQPIFTIGQAEALLTATRDVWDRPVMPGLWPLQSREQALMLRSTLAGISIPDEVVSALPSRTDSVDRAEGVGRDIARTLLARVRDEKLFPGAYIIAPNRDPWKVLHMLNGH